MMINTNKLSCFADEISTELSLQTALMHELGLHYIEFRSANGKGIADFTLSEAVNAYAKLAAAGIQVSALGSPCGKISITDDFAPHFQKFCHTAELAECFHTSRIRIFSFYIPEGEAPERYRDEILRRLSAMSEYAAKKNLILLHENEKGIYGDMALRCLDLMQELYSPSFGCTFDFANFVECGQDTQEAFHLLKPYISYVHIKDYSTASHSVVLPGKGDGQILPILTELYENGYDGFLSLEPHLTDFAALKTLERHAESRGRSDGPKAFAEAHAALLALLSR